MKFIHKDFLLENEAAKRLFHDYAEDMPIIDYHCHLSPQEIAEDLKWENLAQIWLGGDHYKMALYAKQRYRMKSILPEMLPTGRSFRNLRKPCPIFSGIPCITGATLSWPVISALMILS